MDQAEKIDYFRKIYKALRVLGRDRPEVAVPAIASLRLLLIDAVGEETQRELIGKWNEEDP